MAEVLAIALAIATLTSGFAASVDLVQKLTVKWKNYRANKKNLVEVAELERLQESLLLAQNSVQGLYDTQRQRHGQILHVGDDLSRYILFALAARQSRLLRQLQGIQIGDPRIRSLIVSIESTRLAATNCINDLAIRAQRPIAPAQLTLGNQTDLLMDYQNLCPWAILYRTGQAPYSQLASTSRDGAKSTCHHCGAIIGASRISIPGADTSSCVLMNLSGFFRAHCREGGGWACIWQLRVPSCYGVFPNEKALLQHFLAEHVRDDRNPANVKVVDWPSDIRQGSLEKCGYLVQINGLQMSVSNGSLVVPRRARAIN